MSLGRAPRREAHAFTIIELLISIGIIGLLLALAMPALGGARLAARQTLGQTNIRSVAQTFVQYETTYNTFPFLEPGRAVKGPSGFEVPVQAGYVGTTWLSPGSILLSSDPFEMEWMWAGVMAAFVPVEQNYPTWVSPGLPKTIPDIQEVDARDQISIRLSNSFIARPELFVASPRPDAKLIAPVRQSDVRHPSSKVMLFDGHVAFYGKRPEIRESHYDALTPVAFADGHVALKNPTQAGESVPNAMRFARNVKLHSTLDGVAGKDY